MSELVTRISFRRFPREKWGQSAWVLEIIASAPNAIPGNEKPGRGHDDKFQLKMIGAQQNNVLPEKIWETKLAIIRNGSLSRFKKINKLNDSQKNQHRKTNILIWYLH